MLKQMKCFSAKHNCDGESAGGHRAIYGPEIRIRKKLGFGVWLSTARAVPACSRAVRTERTSEIIIFSFRFKLYMPVRESCSHSGWHWGFAGG